MTWSIKPDQLDNTAFRPTPDGRGFTLEIPANANIAADMVTRHAAGAKANKTAVIFETADGTLERYSFTDLENQATCVAAALQRLGIRRGDRVAIHSAQRPEIIVAHLATYKLGAIATTISQLTGPDAMAHILSDSGARMIFTHDLIWEPFRTERDGYQQLEQVITIGQSGDGELAFMDCATADPADFKSAATGPEDPALLIYTSGSTGMPKGILHGHRILHALNASLELFYNLELREDDLVFWTGADWAWVGGLNDVVFPSLAFGHTLIVCDHRFDADWSLQFMARHKVTHILLTPTALKRVALVENARERYGLSLRTIFTGGESLPGETHRALARELGAVCNEGYGMTEVNQMIGNCQKLRPIKPGSMGWEFPGRRVALLDDNGQEVGPDEIGEIAVSVTDPTLFLEYWRQPERTQAVRLNDDWIRTNDLARKDEDGYFWYQGRNDDLIKSAGYRIGPAEVEDCLARHPSIAEAAVIGSPDADRGAIVKAFVRLVAGVEGSPALTKELQAHVKSRLAAYKYPREIEYVADMETTTSGKLNRKLLRELEKNRKGKV